MKFLYNQQRQYFLCIFDKLFHRIKIAWFMLTGKEFLLYDILVDLDSSKVKQMAEFFKNI